MDELTIPEDLNEITTVAAADELLAGIQASATELFGDGSPDDAQLALLQTYAEARAAVEARKVELETEAANRAERVAALREQLGVDDDSDSDSDDGDDDEADGDSNDDSDSDEDEGEADGDGEASSNSKPAFGGLAVKRQKKVPNSAKPKPQANASTGIYSTLDGVGLEKELGSIEQVAKAFHSKFNHSGIASKAGDKQLPVVALRRDMPKEFIVSPGNSFDSAVKAATFATEKALVAACGPVMSAFAVEICGERGTPFRDATPSIEVPRLTLSYMQGQTWRDAVAGVDSRDCDDVADKVPFDFDCESPVEFCATAHYTYATFPNTMQFSHPEQLQADLEKLMIAYDYETEVGWLDTIDADSTAVTSGATSDYGTIRTYVADVTRAAAQYRRRHRLSPNAPLTLVVQPDLYDALRTDALADHADGIISARMSDQDIDAIFAARNLVVVRTMDTATGSSTMADPQAAGALNPWDCTLVSYLYAPGTWVIGEGNQLNIGYFRDSALIARNRVGYFAEEWLGLIKMGCESIKLTTTVNMTGAGPVPVAVRDTCVAG